MKTCNKCKKKKPFKDFYKHTNGKLYWVCKICWRKECKEYYQKNKEKHRELTKRWKERNPERWKEIANKSQNKIRKEKRKIVLEHYGGKPPKCACCGESILEFLTIHHIGGLGNKERKSGRNLSEWIIKNNFPNGFQILCYNCNIGMSFYGDNKICPHNFKKHKRM